MNHRLDERTPRHSLHWPQPVALAPDDTAPVAPDEGASDERESQQPLELEADAETEAEAEAAPSRPMLPLLMATALSALVVMSLTLLALYLGGVFAPGSP